jgi:RimJ/RimL family protein N-acetyltransferase
MVQLAQPLRTTRLELRPFRLEDLDELTRLYERDDVNRYLYFEPRDRDGTLELLKGRIARPLEVSDEEENIITMAVLERGGGLVGDFMLRWTPNVHRQGEMGGSLHPDVHGRGYAPEVYGALLELAFGTYHLHRVVGRCDARNTASVRSLEKAGLHQEAHLVENEFVKGEWTGEIIMAIRRSEWEATGGTRPAS